MWVGRVPKDHTVSRSTHQEQTPHNPTDRPNTAGALLLCATLGGVVFALHLTSAAPTLAWCCSVGLPCFASPALDETTTSVIIATVGGRLLCLALTDGSPRWERSYDKPLFATPTLSGLLPLAIAPVCPACPPSPSPPPPSLVAIGCHSHTVAVHCLHCGHAFWNAAADAEVGCGCRPCTCFSRTLSHPPPSHP